MAAKSSHGQGSGKKSVRLTSTLNKSAAKTLLQHPRPEPAASALLDTLATLDDGNINSVSWKYVKNNPAGLGRFYPEDGVGFSMLQDKDLAHALLADDPIHCLTLGSDAQLDITVQLAKHYKRSCPLLEYWMASKQEAIQRVQKEHRLDPTKAERTVRELLFLSGIPLDGPDILPYYDCGAGGFVAPAAYGDRDGYLAQLGKELDALNTCISQACPSLAQEASRQRCFSSGSGSRGLPLTRNALAILVCNVENQALMAVKETLEETDRTVTHLMFSRLCVERIEGEDAAGGPKLQELLAGCSQAIKRATGLAMAVTTEAMESPYTDAIHGEQHRTLPALFSDLQAAGFAPLQNPYTDRQEDSVVAALLCHVIGPAVRQELRYVGPTGSRDYFAYNAQTGCWRLASTDVAAARLRGAYLRWWLSGDGPQRLPPSYFTKGTHKNMLSGTHSKGVLACMQSYLLDSEFIQRLDSAITNPLTGGLLPFTNICVRVDKHGINMIPHSPEHYISNTIEYELPLGEDGKGPPPSLDFTAVDAWWSNYWGDEKKRKAVMMTIGGALVPAFRDKQKMIIVGTDVADGNTGKSVFWRVIRKVFGMLALPLQREMVYVVPSASKNSHGANEIAYRVSLLTCCDELKNQEKFDMESMKQKGGGGFEMMCRAFGSPDMIKFPWMATVLLLCNKGCLPQIDCTNAVEIGRFRFICFETRFVTPSGAEVPEGYDKKLVKAGEDEVASKMLHHRGAHMWRLLQAAHEMVVEHGGALTPEEWPSDWNLLKHEAAAEADVIYGFVREVVEKCVEAGIAVKKGEAYFAADGKEIIAEKSMVDRIKRQDLVDIVMSEGMGKGQRGLKSKDVKDRLGCCMRELGYKYIEDSSHKGVACKQAFVGCRLKRGDELGL
jgi:hypothetical protein